MKKLLLLLCLLVQTGLASTPRIDSLKRELKGLNSGPNGYTKDILRYQVIKAIMRDYADVNLDSSMHYNTLLTKLCNTPTFQNELSYAYQFAGYLYLVRGDYDQSILTNYNTLKLAEQFKQYTRMARSYGALAHAYVILKDYDMATKRGQQGLDILRNHPDATVKLSILNVFGAMYREQGKFADALKVNQNMYKLAQQEQIAWYEAQGLHTIGWDYMGLEDMDKPLGYYEKALILARKVGSVDLEGSILLHIAEAYIQQKKWKKAFAYCNQAKQTAIRIKNTSIIKEAEETFYKIYKQRGQLEKALAAHEKFIFLRDSLSQATNQQRIGMLKAHYENEQNKNALKIQQLQLQTKESQNQQLDQKLNMLFIGIAAILLISALLYWNNRRLQSKNQEIDKQRNLLETAQKQLADINKTLETRVDERTTELVNANQELIQKNEEIKTALFKGQTIERKRVALELHDNLSSLLSAVNMSVQAISPDNLSEPEQIVYRNVKQLIQNAYTEVRNISHNILPAGLESEGIVPTLTILIDRLNQNSSLQFSLTIKGLKDRLPREIEFNVYSIVLELINNSIKHAKATTVTIYLLRNDSGIELSVADDGIGSGQNQIKRGVGLQNIQTRLASLGGTLNVTYPEEKGTRIEIKIPIETVHLNGKAQVG